MRLRACITLLLLLSACATTEPSARAPVPQTAKFANLQRAALLPWVDGGQCAVQEASNTWPVLVERCFHTLDHERIRFRDLTGRCAVASAEAAAVGIGVCVLVAPEVIAGAVIVTGAVVVAVAIQEELDAYRLRQRYPEEETTREEAGPAPEIEFATQEHPGQKRPKPKGPQSDQNRIPPAPPESFMREPRPECIPKRVPPKGGNRLHNECSDNVPLNSFRGANALVNGKAFDALQPSTRTLWEVKTTAIETYNPFIQQAELDSQVAEARRERDLAAACGYQFVIGVRTEAHKKLLEREDLSLSIFVMDWC
ncbi:DUF6310 domain-containing protein [Myxococcaceae bacterium GXIMD 01537]